MFGYTVSDLAALVGGTLSGEGSAAVTSIVKDNRVAVPGCLFAAMPGEKSDGHRFIGAASAAERPLRRRPTPLTAGLTPVPPTSPSSAATIRRTGPPTSIWRAAISTAAGSSPAC